MTGEVSNLDGTDGPDEAVLRKALTHDDHQVRREAALTLIDRADDGLEGATARALTERVERDPDADVRQFAVEAFGVAGRDAGIDTVRSALDDPDEWVRAEAVVVLSRIAPDATGTFEDRLTDDSPWVRRNALIALGKTGTVARSTLEERIRTDPHPAVREYAAAYLPDAVDGAGDGDDDVEAATRILAAVLAREPNAFVRAKAATGLGDLGTDLAERALEEQGLNDRSEDVRRAAKRALAAVRGIDPDRIETDDPTPPGGGGNGSPSGRPPGPPSTGSERPSRPPSAGSGRPSREPATPPSEASCGCSDDSCGSTHGDRPGRGRREDE
ncbi:MAG TPA: HEAT repeat domain-containing protein [Natrialbaceae archaeon]|nr:HEAT repeat domain-containing protein [Natrialbaceae archaeon]